MADKIINSFDVWITAQGVKSKLRLRNIDNVSLEGVARLREVIFQLAAEGRLLNVHKGKSELTTIGQIADLVMGQAPPGDECNTQGIGTVFVKTGEFGKLYPETVEWTTKPLKLAKKGDILICVVGATVGKLNLAIDCAIGRSVAAIRPSKQVDTKYLYYCLMPYTLKLRNQSRGSAQGVIGKAELNAVAIRLPSIAEQKLIAIKVDELMALCDELEKKETHHLKSHQLLVETLLGTLTRANDAAEFQTAWSRLAQHFDDIFTTEDSIDQLKQTILQLAVKGKLVPQDPNEELYQRNNNFTGKVEGPEKPYPLPVSWRWLRWSELLDQSKYSMKRGPFGSALRKGDFVESGIRVFEQYNPINDDPNWVRYYVTPKKYEEMKAFTAGPGDLLISCSGATLGRITELTDEVEPGIINQALLKVRLNPRLISNRYFILIFRSKFIQDLIFEKALGSAIPNMVGVAELKRIVMGIPPLKEQHKIIIKLTELLALCDRLKERIAESKKVVNLMAEAVLEQV